MGLRSYVKNTVKANSNVRGWVAWDAILQNAQIIAGFIRDFKKSKTTTVVPKTFEETVTELGLTESDIQQGMKRHRLISICCAVLGVGALLWTIVLLMKVMLLSALVSLSLSGLMFAYAFQENFRYYQMKQRRLNCTIQDWFSNLFSRNKRWIP